MAVERHHRLRLSGVLRWGVLGLGAIGVATTLLPLFDGNEALIRIWDFPRAQVAVVLALALLGTPFVLHRRAALFMAVVLAGALLWQLTFIRPYTPAYSPEVRAVAECAADSRIDVLVANVLVDNHDAGPLLALERRLEPDLVLLVETSHDWHRRLQPMRERFGHEVAHPRDDGYGMHLFSRLELIEPEVRFLIEDYVPSIRTGVQLRSGARVDFYGVHPKPPPIDDTERRDAELLIVGREVKAEPAPAIVAGDLNDVGWSATTRLFQDISGLLDPRIGRGFYSTFNANWLLLHWPLDHVFFEESFWLLDVGVESDIGSDHLPFFVSLCHDREAAAAQEGPRSDASDEAQADEAIGEGRDEAQDE